MYNTVPYPVRAQAALELRRRREARRATEGEAKAAEVSEGFRGFVRRQNPTLLSYAHVPRLVDIGERILAGALKRVIVLMAPRYFKSELFARLLTAAFLRRNPKLLTGLASYGADLAWSLSEESKNYFQMDGGELRRDTTAKKRWRTAQGGEMWATGVGGPMLGFGYHLGVIDDPTDPEKASSFTYQRRFEEWWPSKFISRQEPGASIVVDMQRLGPMDPIDYLFRREVGEDTDEAPEHWHVVCCEEIKSNAALGRWDGPRGLPPTCTLEPDPRRVGEVLAPSRFSRDEVLRLQTAAGTYVTACQRQQRPAAPTGDFWKKGWFDTYEELPPDAYDGGKDWDTAYTKEEKNSATAWVETYRGPGAVEECPIYVQDLDWDWREFPEMVDWMAEVGGPHYIEQKASGKSAVQSLKRSGVTAEEVAVNGGDKLARAAGVQAIVANRRIKVRSCLLRKLLEGDRQGLLRVRAENLATGRGDLDLNDAFVQAINRHVGNTQYHGDMTRFTNEGLTRTSPWRR